MLVASSLIAQNYAEKLEYVHLSQESLIDSRLKMSSLLDQRRVRNTKVENFVQTSFRF